MPGFVFLPERAKVVADLGFGVRTLPYDIGLAFDVPVMVARADLTFTVLTAPARAPVEASLTFGVTTLDLNLPDEPAPEVPTGVDEYVPGTRLWQVTHALSIAKVKGFSVEAGDRQTEATGSAQVRGDVSPSGDIYITTTALPKHGGTPRVERYGPFRRVSRSVTTNAAGDLTDVSLADTTAKAARALATELPELVPWIEHLSPLEQVQRERDDAVRERALSKLPCYKRRELERGTRSIEINTLLERVRDFAPVPTILTAPFPFAGVYLYERSGEVVDPETGFKVDDDGMIQPDYDGTKGKLWDAVLLEFLSPFGWEITLKGGVAYIGPRGALVEAGGSADALGVDPGDLTQKKMEERPGGTGETVWWSTSPVPATGSDELPWRVDVTLARERTHFEPLPPENTKDAPPDPDGTEETVTYGTNEAGEIVSTTTRRTTRAAGRVVREETLLDTFVDLHPPQFALTGGLAQVWQPGASVSVTTHEYGLARFPDAETRTVETVHSYIPTSGRVELVSAKVTEQDWSEATGYLRSKVVAIRSMTALRPRLQGTNNAATLVYDVVFGYATEEERWRNEGGGWWLYTVSSSRNVTRGQYDENIPEFAGAISIPDASDQTPPQRTRNPPPQARLDDRCPEDPPEWQKFPVISDHVVSFYTGGLGAPASISLPWFREVPPGLVGQFLSRVQPRRVLTFTAPVPLPVLDVAQRKLRVTGRPGAVTSEVQIEEVL